MKRSTGVLALAVAALLAAPGGAAATTEEERMRALEQRLMALEDKLEASSATIDAQRELLEKQAPPAVSQGASYDPFLNGLDIGGYVVGSYIYNFNGPDSNTFSQSLCQFNCNHDEFSFDAAMLTFGKEAAEPGQAGFQLDLLFGQNSTISRALSPTGSGFDSADSDNGVFVQEAYITYNWAGTELKFGNWETLLGWELLDSHLNYNITHGVLFTWAIPLYHTGLLVSHSFGETGFSASIGVSNGFNNVFDTNDNKGLLGIFAYEAGPFFTSLSWFYGKEEPNLGVSSRTSDDLAILDFVASVDLDPVFLWLNFDWGEHEDATVLTGLVPDGGGMGGLMGVTAQDDSDYWGIAIGGNLQLTEKLSFALRGEYWSDDNNVRGAASSQRALFTDTDMINGPTGFGAVDGADVEIMSLTGTMKYQLTEQAYVRAELRWDKADDDVGFGALKGNGGAIFPDGSRTVSGSKETTFDDSEVFGIIEVGYVFD